MEKYAPTDNKQREEAVMSGPASLSRFLSVVKRIEIPVQHPSTSNKWPKLPISHASSRS